MMETTLRFDKDGQPVDRTLHTAGHSRGGAPEYVLRGMRYDYIRTLSEGSGEAEIFLVKRGGQEYALKIYYPEIDINRETLRIVANIDFDMIVKVYDFGTVFLDGKKRAYELMEYLRGGTLAQLLGKRHGDDIVLTDEDFKRFRRVALQAAAAIACCHNYNLIHKDVKPSNIFFRDEKRTQVVLGDFGIASVIADEGGLHRTTQARTPLYAAPEMYSDVIDGEVEISPAADYYSLGVTLLSTLDPQLYMVKSKGERDIIKRKAEGRLPGVDKLPERVKLLIQGLTAVRPESRWTYREVEQWFLGETPSIDLSSPYLKYGAFVFDPERNMVAENVRELVIMMSENEAIASNYLYSGKIREWLEHSGNVKLAVAVDDIVKNRYPADKTAGLMTAIYTMDPSFPYKDIKGNECHGLHEAAVAMMADAEQYAMVLKNDKDRLWNYIRVRSSEQKVKSDLIDHPSVRTVTDVKMLAFAMDAEMPFLQNHRSQSIEEITYAFGHERLTDDDWMSIIDGRYAAWLGCHENAIAAETVKILTESVKAAGKRGQSSSLELSSGSSLDEVKGDEIRTNIKRVKELAYNVIYNIDRDAAYDLAEAHTPQKIGDQLAQRLMALQHADDEEITKAVSEFADAEGRFAHYAALHGWYEYATEAVRCFNLNSEENKERLGMYDIRTAAYRFVRILGSTPTYVLPSGDKLTHGLNIDNRHRSDIRTEMHTGCFMQWLAVFYHEDPTKDFSEEYGYERALEEWVNTLGYYDAQTIYYKRFTQAKEDTANRTGELRSQYKRLKKNINGWRTAYYALNIIWIALLIIFGIKDRTYTFNHYMLTIVLPVGGTTALIAGTRGFLKGYGFMICCFWGLVGALTSFIPVYVLRYIDKHTPELTIMAIILFTAIYMVLCHRTGKSMEAKEDARLIETMMGADKETDVQSSLIEPLYYTFKTKGYHFRGSKFGMLDDVQDRLRNLSGEITLHYGLWNLMVAALVAEMIIMIV